MWPAVVSLSPQTYGANMAGLVSPRPMLIVHGKADTRLPYSCGMQVFEWANEPKQLVLYEGAEHRLEECREELGALLTQWIPATLNAVPGYPIAGPGGRFDLRPNSRISPGRELY